MFQFGLYRVLIVKLGVLLGFYKFNVHKYNLGNLTTSEQTKLCAPSLISGTPCGGPDPRLGTTALDHSALQSHQSQCQDSRFTRHLLQKTQTHLFRLHLDPTEHDSLPNPPTMKLYALICSYLQHLNHSTYALKVSLMNSSFDTQMRSWKYFFFLLHWRWCRVPLL